MLRKYSRIKLTIASLDIIGLFGSLWLAFFFRYKTGLFGETSSFPWLKFLTYAIFLPMYVFIFRLNNLYKQRIFLTSYDQFFQIIRSLLWGMVIYVIGIFLFRGFLVEHSRVLLSLFFVFALVLLIFERAFLLRSYFRMKAPGMLRRRVITIGAGKAGTDFLVRLRENLNKNIEIVGFFDDDPDKKGKSVLGVPVLGTTEDLDYYLRTLKIAIDGIYICISHIQYDNLSGLIDKCKVFGYPLYLNSRYFIEIDKRIDVREFSTEISSPICWSKTPLYSRFIKRFLDVVVSAAALLLLLPFFLIVAVVVKLTSKGPIFYTARVVGKNEKQFVWYKFRTMTVKSSSAEHDKFMYEMIKNKKNGEVLKLDSDNRVTKVGRILRKFSIDELPQLINVLRGQMSLIGPRPCSTYEHSLYEPWHKKRFEITPGISGLWQAFGRSAVGYDDMVIMDLYYIENLSFWLDAKIFIKTIYTVLLGKGAY